MLKAAAGSASLAVNEGKRGNIGSHSLSALYRKEMADHVTSKRFIIIMILVIATTIASVYGAVTGISSAIKNAAMDPNASFDAHFMFLKLFTTGGSSIPSYMSLIALIGPFIGLILGFDSINSEKNNGTLNRLVSQPIYRDSIIIGKFLASSTLIAVMILSTGIAVGCAGFLATGILPSGEEAVRVLIYLVYTILYICFWLAMAMLFSVFTRHAATSALASIALWLFFAIFMSLLAGIMANAVYPVNTEYQQAVNAFENYNLNLNLNRLSPYYLYSEASSVLMDPATRAINAVSYAQLVGALSGYLQLGQSLLLVWPHLVGLLALTFAAFTISYIGFMRQEIRTS
ncbi:MAG: ABC transporter permease [Lachnospiraceae bacterium]|nr:ABC transporter permease [Lachnospiraceae bacterium]